MGNFSEFINARRFSSLADFMLDEGHGQQFEDQRFPIPMNLAMILSMVPGGPTYQGGALKYIMTNCLFRAAKGREILAKQMSEMVGRPVEQYEVFSPEAHKEDPKVGAAWEKLKDEYFQKYEPKYIRLQYPHAGDVTLSFEKLNQVLAQHGLPPFQFGGPTGFVELMETGRNPATGKEWAKGRKSMMPSMGNHDRNGFDLSHPRIHRYSDKPNEPMVAFGFGPNMTGDRRAPREPGWEPSINKTYYTRRLEQWLSRMSDKAERLMASIPDGDPQKEEFAKIFGSIAQGMTRSKTIEPNMTFGHAGGEVALEDPKEYERIKGIVTKAWQAYNNMPDEKRTVGRSGVEVPVRKATEDEIKDMMRKMFPTMKDENGQDVPLRDQAGNYIINQQVSGFGPYVDLGKRDTPVKISSMFNWLKFNQTGRMYDKKRLAEPNDDRGDFYPMTLPDRPEMGDVFGSPKATQTEIGPYLSQDILKDKYPEYFPMDDSEGTVDEKIAKREPVELTNGRDEIIFRFDKKKNTWTASQLSDEILPPHKKFDRAKIGGSPVILPGSTELGYLPPQYRHTYSPAFGKNRDALMAKWKEFAAENGTDWTEEMEIAKKTAYRKVGGRGDEKDFDKYKEYADDIMQAFMEILNTPEFFYGKTGKHFVNLLMKNNYEEQDAQEISNYLTKTLDAGKVPSKEDLVATWGPEGEGIYKLLLKNGAGWRIGTAAEIFAGQIAHAKEVHGKERTGVGATNSDGEVNDIMGNASTSAAKERLAKGQDVTTALKGKLNKRLSGRAVLSGNSMDVAAAGGVNLDQTDIYKKEGEQLAGVQKPIFDRFYQQFHGEYQPKFKPDDTSSLYSLNAKISNLENEQPSGDIIRLAGNAAVMDVLHHSLLGYLKTLDQDRSKRAVANIFHHYLDPQNGVSEILTNDDDVVPEGEPNPNAVDVEPLRAAIMPILKREKPDGALATYMKQLKAGGKVQFASPEEEKPAGMRVVGNPAQATMPAKPTLGGTAPAPTPAARFKYGNRDWSHEEFQKHYSKYDADDINDFMPPATWHQIPEPSRSGLKAHFDKMNQQGLQKAESLISIDTYLTRLRETDAVYDGSKPTTFNWWGAVGDPLGKVIDGDVPVKKKKKKHAGK